MQSEEGLCCPLTDLLDTTEVSMESKCPFDTLHMCGMNMNVCFLRMLEDILRMLWRSLLFVCLIHSHTPKSSSYHEFRIQFVKSGKVLNIVITLYTRIF